MWELSFFESRRQVSAANAEWSSAILHSAKMPKAVSGADTTLGVF